MANIAIKGHKTRGKEVIEILEMLGGNSAGYTGTFNNFYYWIEGGVITSSNSIPFNSIQFTLEEFEEKYPYKVGDKVYNIIHNENQTITEVAWDFQENVVVYQTNNNEYLFVNYLQPYKGEIMEGVYAYNEINCYHQDFGDKVRIRLGNDFEIKVEDKITYIVKKQSQYPKDYEECFNICFGNKHHIVQVVGLDGLGDNKKLFESFIKLKICRDAYWKIAGEEMELDNPWEPDYDSGVNKYGIISMNGAVQKSNPTTNWERHLNKVLDFPTEEMRDAFYENFENLIEECKELL